MPLNAQTDSSWNGGTGNWSNSANWTPSSVPNNGGGTTYNVAIAALNSAVSLDVSTVTINNVSLAASTSLTINLGNSLSLVSGTSTNNGTIENSNAHLINNSNSLFMNFGTLNNSGSGAQLINYGTLSNSGTITTIGNFDSYGTLANSGTFFVSDGLTNIHAGGTLNNTGTVRNGWNMGNNGTINNMSNSTFNNSFALDNTGTINNMSASSFSNGFSLTNEGTINNGSGATFTNSQLFSNSGTFNNNGLFTNSGQVTITSTGVFNTSTNYTQTAGSTQVNGTLATTNGAMIDIQGGTLSGNGTINSNLVMSGTLIAGTPGNPLQLNINGDYTQTGSGTFIVGVSSTGNGMLNVSGAVVLDPGALLDIQLADGFDPQNGTSYFILDYGSETGTFTIGDPFFNNGTQQWVISSYAGGDGNNIVLTAEAAGPTATPEPSTILLLGAGLLGMLGYAGKRTTSTLCQKISVLRRNVGAPMAICQSVSRLIFSPNQLLLWLLLVLFATPLNGQTNSSWNGGTGNWSNSANWTPFAVPNNDATTTYNVAVGAPNSAVSMDVLNVTINNLNLASSTSLNMSPGNSLSLVSGISTNNGTINNVAGQLINNSNSLFRNFGTLNNDIFTAQLTNYGTLSNTGTITTLGSVDSYGTLANSGTFSVNGGVTNFHIGGLLNNTGAFTNGSFMGNNGTIDNMSNSTFNNFSALTNTGIINNKLDSSFSNNGLSLSNEGTINNESGAAFTNSGPFTNSGTFNNNGTFTNSGQLTIASGGLFNTTTNYTQTAGYTQVDGTLTATSGIVDIQGGTLSGGGIINGTVSMSGTLIGGDGAGNPLTLNINGDYTQSGTYTELISSTANSLLNVSGAVAIMVSPWVI